MREGLGRASMEAIAREAGMSKRTLYDVFDSKAALFAAIVRRIRTAVTRPLSQDELCLPLACRLRLLLTPASGELPGHIPVAILRAIIAEAGHQPELAREFMQEGPDALTAMIRAELDRSVARDEIRIADTESAAGLLRDMAYDNVIGTLVDPQLQARSAEQIGDRLDLAITVFVRGASQPG